MFTRACLVPCQRAGDFAATVLPLQGWRLRRPSPRSAYAYTPSGARPAESAHALKQSVPLAAAKSPAHVTFWPWGRQSRPHPSLRAEPCDLPRHPRPIRVAWLRRGIPRHRHARVSARLPRTGRPPPPCVRSSASPSDPDLGSGGVCPFAASCALPPCGGTAWSACRRRRAEGGAREDGADRRPPRWFRLLRRFSQRGRACLAILTYAWRTLRLREGRLGRAARQPTPRCHTADFHLSQ
jgi:hypothetical protein